MRKIHVTRQFFKGSGRHGDLIEKTKNPFLDKVNGSMCAKFQVCIVVSVARRRDTNKQTNKYTNTYTSEFRNILGGCSPHVDFDCCNQGSQIIENHKRRCVNFFKNTIINFSFQITQGFAKCPQKYCGHLWSKRISHLDNHAIRYRKPG